MKNKVDNLKVLNIGCAIDMAREKQPDQRLQLVAGFVPPPVKSFIKEMAEKDGRTESQILRKLLERVPEVRAAIKKARAA